MFINRNPKKGVIINRPDGPNVYDGVLKDYVDIDVTPTNFLNILSGKDMTGVGSGKTIKRFVLGFLIIPISLFEFIEIQNLTTFM